MYKLVLTAKDIPDNSLVTKIKGTKQHTLHSKIVIPNITVINNDDVKFLISEKSNYIVPVAHDTELMWYVEHDELLYWLS